MPDNKAALLVQSAINTQLSTAVRPHTLQRGTLPLDDVIRCLAMSADTLNDISCSQSFNHS